ncbi:complex I assembly factor TIMMDC1, mitochondrial [Phodopus roborovskii]|uniref:Complex I assembly factor TIMMDC1, mitochondrial n=1 Tax=Phodopus roborovskii TaxID=109678 RepID=A0AAU9ZI17_PHORO|nr:complex I assembly factor TIMMDC1, mitochondrial [Phodopus roborovskii]CAH6792334.1 Timmdc1 [Phodopus roborovskii]
MEAPPPAPRSRLCRAFAAGAAAADSQGFAEDREPRAPRSCVSEPGSPESGWDRLRQLFVKDEQQRIPKEVEYICRAAVSAGIIGWAYGGIPAFIYAKNRYIEQSQGEVYHNRFDAVQSAHRAGTRGFLRYGWRWSWRTAVFVTIFNTVNTGLTVYRNKSTLSHFVIAGAVTGGLFRVNLGIRGLVAGGIIGALLGTPMGSLMMALQKYCDETVQERRQKDQKALHEQKLQEWRRKLQLTELLPEEIESGLEKIRPEENAQRIQELLNLPRNPPPPDKPNKD